MMMNKNCERVMKKVNMCKDMTEVLLILKGLYELRDTKEDSRVIAGINSAIELVKERIKEIERGDYMFTENGLKRNSNKHAYNGNDRTDKLVARFFDLLENDGEWNELFLIRDLMIEETIYNGYSVLGMLQIDDILEEDLERFLDRFNIVNNYEVEELEKKVFGALCAKDVERSIQLINEYGENSNNHPYVYYCAVRELERITGENYIELCL